MNEQIETAIIAFRVTKKFKELMEEYVLKDTHSNLSDFIRSAIREKIQRDSPQLIRTIFEESESRDEDIPEGSS